VSHVPGGAGGSRPWFEDPPGGPRQPAGRHQPTARYEQAAPSPAPAAYEPAPYPPPAYQPAAPYRPAGPEQPGRGAGRSGRRPGVAAGLVGLLAGAALGFGAGAVAFGGDETPAAAGAPQPTAAAAKPAATPSRTPAARTGTYSIDDVRVGECFESSSDSMTSARLLPCARKHRYEAYGRYQLTGRTFPGEAQVRADGLSRCDKLFAPYVGRPRYRSIFSFRVVRPTAETWVQGDRRGVCVLIREDGGSSTGSARGIDR